MTAPPESARLAIAWRAGRARLASVAAPAGLALVVFAGVLLAFGKNQIKAYVDIFSSTLGSPYGFSETLVKMTPLVLTAVAVAVPAKIWLINVGGEGQLYIGAIFATWGALTFGHLPGWLLLPLMVALGFLGGGLWGPVSGLPHALGPRDARHRRQRRRRPTERHPGRSLRGRADVHRRRPRRPCGDV